MIVCNKIDLTDDREVTTEEGQSMAKQYNLKYFETSAKTGEGI
jgi:putative ribosome biogenesis GTPase RsgA